jgi:hypothetical protein
MVHYQTLHPFNIVYIQICFSIHSIDTDDVPPLEDMSQLLEKVEELRVAKKVIVKSTAITSQTESLQSGALCKSQQVY